MGKGLIALLLIGLFVVVIGMWGVGKYNGFVTANEQVSAQWSQVENVYQRRMDLIPNLVETVKGVANFEQKTYTDVAEARARAGQITISKELLNNPESFAQFEKAQGELSGALSRLLATVENYPQLKVNQQFPRPANAARRHGKPDHGGAPAIQRSRARLQHARQALPRPAHRRSHRIRAAPVLPGP